MYNQLAEYSRIFPKRANICPSHIQTLRQISHTRACAQANRKLPIYDKSQTSAFGRAKSQKSALSNCRHWHSGGFSQMSAFQISADQLSAILRVRARWDPSTPPAETLASLMASSARDHAKEAKCESGRGVCYRWPARDASCYPAGAAR
jgi:hypothetical protein